jgi:hypothetical protein
MVVPAVVVVVHVMVVVAALEGLGLVQVLGGGALGADTVSAAGAPTPWLAHGPGRLALEGHAGNLSVLAH